MTLYLVRHTSVAVPANLCYGRTEVPLSSTFATEAEAVRAALPTCLATVFTSPAERCRRLAHQLGPDLMVDQRLSELDFGEWEGSPWTALPGHELDRWYASFVEEGPPGGESVRALAVRATRFAVEHGEGAGDVVAVTHAGVIRALLAWYRQEPLLRMFETEVPFGSIRMLTPPFPPPLVA